jgi:hypothetical protein
VEHVVPPPKPIEVVLEESHMGGSFFVEIINVPWGAGVKGSIVVPVNAMPRARAEIVKAAVEQALHEYRRPPKRTPKKPVRKTAWDRITKEKVVP